MSKYILIILMLISCFNCYNNNDKRLHLENEYLKVHFDFDINKYDFFVNSYEVPDDWESSTLISLEDTTNGISLKIFYELPEMIDKNDFIAQSIEIDKTFKKAGYSIIEKELGINFNTDKKIYFHSVKQDFMYTFGISSIFYKPEGFFRFEFTKRLLKPKEINYVEIVKELKAINALDFKVDKVKEPLMKVQKDRGIFE